MYQDIEKITAMHTYKRPMGSEAEKEYRARFIEPTGAKPDKFGNLMLTVGQDKPTVLWSSHTDTVHRSDGLQRIEFDGTFLRLHKKSKSSCLGADDTAGNWIMLEMIKAEVPGLYVFHFGEESGCIGSAQIANETPEVLDGIQAAIAFDRMGTTSVITKQGAVCCSDAFGASLIRQLPTGFKLDPNGIYTDTREYMGLVPECTNLSVGYYSQHSSNEKIDVSHLIRLRDHMICFDQTSMVIERQPKTEPRFSGRTTRGLGRLNLQKYDLSDLLWMHPNEAAAVLQDAGVTYEAFKAAIDRKREARWATRRLGQQSGLFDDSLAS